MLDLFLKLIEKLIDLANESQKVKRALHEDFVLPAMEQFEAVHQEYISSFQSYRDLVVSQSPNFNRDNPVFKRLESDMIFSHVSKEKLRAISEGLSPFIERYSSNENKINRFIRTMAGYVNLISDSAGNRYRNAPRGSLVESLTRIAEGEDRFHRGMLPAQEAESEIMEKMWEMQDQYFHIQNAYQEAKTELLK